MYTVFCIQYYCPLTVSLYPVEKDCMFSYLSNSTASRSTSY